MKEIIVFTINQEINPDEKAPQNWSQAENGIERYEKDGYQIEGISTTSAISGTITLTVVMSKEIIEKRPRREIRTDNS